MNAQTRRRSRTRPASRSSRPRLVFITGTDTGVGKTVFTVVLLRALRAAGLRAVALKPFCSGPRDDAVWLARESGDVLTVDETNPHHFPEPLAPAASKRGKGPPIKVASVVRAIRTLCRGFDIVLIEGIGGALVPITENTLLADVISALRCPAIVVGRDALGTLNHSILTLNELRRRKIPVAAIVLMKIFSDDLSSKTNKTVLSQHVAPVSVATLPKLRAPNFRRAAKSREQSFLKKTIAGILQLSIFSTRCRCHNGESEVSKRRRGRASL